MAHGDAVNPPAGVLKEIQELIKTAIVRHGPQNGRFDPPLPSEADELIKYVLVEIDVPTVFHEAFQNKMRELAEVMFDFMRWELVFAAYPLTGVVNRFVHIWKIPDESSLLMVMREGALREKDRRHSKHNLEQLFRDCYRSVQDMIVETRHTLMTSLSYDPENVGYQTQTILITTSGHKFIIDHDELRAKFDQDPTKNIAHDLEKIRVGAFTKRLKPDGAATTTVQATIQERGLQLSGKSALTPEQLVVIQEHLNRGTAVAHLDVSTSEGVGKDNALLFNLAGLKARSVFQELRNVSNSGKSHEALKALEQAEPHVRANELGGKRLLIAAPWGSVYNLDYTDLCHVLQPIPGDQEEGTDAAVRPLIEGRAPIASVPAERYEIVGDGCACYVINLNSFVRKV